MSHERLVETARHLADELLFPVAMTVDTAARVPETHLLELARAGLFGLAGPASAGGLEVPEPVHWSILEALAGGCLATSFVWLQHHGSVQALARTSNDKLAHEWLPELCAGRQRGGLALSGIRPGRRQLRARAVMGGVVLDGDAPWVSGWSLVDVLLTPARMEEQIVTLLIDAVETDTLIATPVPLVAANASRNVRVAFRGHFIPEERILGITPYADPPLHDGGGRSNGSLALGVTRRACRLMGEPASFVAELDACRSALDAADELAMARARAASVDLALRATAALLVHDGSRSIALDAHPQRLAREALFLCVFGSRPAIKHELLETLSARAR